LGQLEVGWPSQNFFRHHWKILQSLNGREMHSFTT
jgi:hypothetical protein